MDLMKLVTVCDRQDLSAFLEVFDTEMSKFFLLTDGLFFKGFMNQCSSVPHTMNSLRIDYWGIDCEESNQQPSWKPYNVCIPWFMSVPKTSRQCEHDVIRNILHT